MVSMRNDGEILQLMFKYGSFLLVLPKLNFKTESVEITRLRVFSATVFAFFVICGYLLSATGRIITTYKYLGAIHKFLDFSTYTLLTLLNVCIILQPIVKRNAWQRLIKQLLTTNINITKKQWFSYVSLFLLLHVYYFLVLFFENYIWVGAEEAPLYTYYFLSILQEYYCLLMVFFMGLLNLMLRKRFKKLRYTLKKPTKHQIEEFLNLYKAVARYNRIFYWQYLLIVTHAAFSILDNLEMALMYYDGSTSSVSYDKFFISLCGASNSILKLFVLIISCDLTTKEADCLTVICYLQQKIYPQGSAARHELKKLAVLASNLKVEFTAADFFTINRTTLFSVLRVVTAYFIVILEFRQ